MGFHAAAQHAWTVGRRRFHELLRTFDVAPHGQVTNLENTAISYYPKGELIGMVMDLLIRGRTKGKSSLDEVMRRMYDEFYLKSPNSSYYLRGRGYQTDDLERVASRRAGFDL